MQHPRDVFTGAVNRMGHATYIRSFQSMRDVKLGDADDRCGLQASPTDEFASFTSISSLLACESLTVTVRDHLRTASSSRSRSRARIEGPPLNRILSSQFPDDHSVSIKKKETEFIAEFNITNEVQAQLTLSIFVLAYAIGPLFLGPLSEIYGRVIVLQISNWFFLIWNLGCSFAQTSGRLMLFSSLVAWGLLSDCFHTEQRGLAISIYSLAPLLRPAIGPIAGGFIAQNTTWR
ncbi:hypothetical protein LEMA_P113720.1 [Plenodomus lingam JN3]|uniref:Major facilitator superfamily (MFS) profile domain-containing protein n=1 Tax=Leptosphaeria maculans (strain JN3 / isolate v23.1.3 / race Av1-4-5-6-7-8) TaxID=985895 RepID=E4ZU78_LEPMJ|nr:hypothetical protein LEMA_P113720.1 [Plenodomus lingam JN3]CBX94957.1 hypothetical protein LEMA_P113720.1 [Plenodomus lingam JN3]